MSELDKFISNLPQGIDTIVGERCKNIWWRVTKNRDC